MQWFRFYSEAISDMKLRRIARDINMPVPYIVGVWTAVLSMASDSPHRGELYISTDVPATVDDVSDYAGCNVTVTFQKLLSNGVVTETVTENGKIVFSIPAWNKRQFESDNSATRVRTWREHRKNAQSNANVTLQKRFGNAPDTDTDTDHNKDLNTYTADAVPPVAPPDVAQPAKTPTAQQAMFEAVAETCQLDSNLKANKGRIGKTAADLVGAGYTPEQVRSFTVWWQANDWRAKTAPVPTMAQVTEKIAQCVAGVAVAHPSYMNSNSNANGKLSKVELSMQAIDRVFDRIEGKQP